MASFADRLIQEIRAKDSRCVVGLDPRIDQMPAFVRSSSPCTAITEFHELVLDAVADLVPAVNMVRASASRGENHRLCAIAESRARRGR